MFVTRESRVPSEAFDAWLGDVVARLAARRNVSAPHLWACHPREDHLVPI
jgi:hypothetical protein